MEKRYQFQYSKYLASNSTINQAFMEWLWEGEDMKSGGASGVNIKKYFPEIYQLVEDLVDLGKLPENKLDELDKLDIILVRNIAEDLWISFSKKKKTEKGTISFLTGGIDLIIKMNKGDKEPWFVIRGK